MRLANVLNLGIKELRSLLRDPVMLVLLVCVSASPYSAATAIPETLHKAPISIVDEDCSLRGVDTLRQQARTAAERESNISEEAPDASL